MKNILSRASLQISVLGLCLSTGATNTMAQSQRVYRCGSVYTNQPDGLQHCKSLLSGNVTVIEGTRIQSPQATGSRTSAAGADIKIDPEQQRRRDTQAQAVLQVELQRAQKQQTELLQEWNNGHPEYRPDEMKQPQKYQDRVAQLRAALPRIEADIAGLQRELSRLAGAAEQLGIKP